MFQIFCCYKHCCKKYFHTQVTLPWVDITDMCMMRSHLGKKKEVRTHLCTDNKIPLEDDTRKWLPWGREIRGSATSQRAGPLLVLPDPRRMRRVRKGSKKDQGGLDGLRPEADASPAGLTCRAHTGGPALHPAPPVPRQRLQWVTWPGLTWRASPARSPSTSSSWCPVPSPRPPRT